MRFRIYTKPGCPFCDQAKELIGQKGDTFIAEDHNTPDKVMEFKAAGYATFPQVFLDDRHIGGFDDLQAFYNEQDSDDF